MPDSSNIPEDDVAVRKEGIMELFNPPPGHTTFYDWVKKGRIVQARDVSGYFLLNATRKRMRMPLVDVAEYRRRRMDQPKGLKNSQLLYLAVTHCDPRLVSFSAPPQFPVPDSLTMEELDKIEILQREHLKLMEHLEEGPMQTVYRQGFLDALDAAMFVDRQ